MSEWILGSDHKALGELLASVDSLDQIEKETDIVDQGCWMPVPEAAIQAHHCMRYRLKSRKLAAPWREIDIEHEYMFAMLVRDDRGNVISTGAGKYGRELLVDGWKYYMSLDDLPPLFEGE